MAQDPQRIVSQDDMHQDLAGTYKSTAGEGADDVDEGRIARDHDTLMRDGYVVLENMLGPDDLAAFRAEVGPLFDKTGRNTFEGAKTQRVYAVVAKSRIIDKFIAHPHVLAILDKVLQPNYLLSQSQAINILPGEEPQPVHYDTAFYAWPRPRPPLGAATIWEIDDFTKENGATVVCPGSHQWGEGAPPDDAEKVYAEMPAGSCVLFLGNLWHGGGANQTDKDRMAFTAQYCEPWLRTQENYSLAVPKAAVADRSEAMKRLLGYSIHAAFMGMVNGMHPKRVLEDQKPAE